VKRATASSRWTDPATSRRAAAEVERSGAAQRQRDLVLDVVRAEPGLTATEIASRALVERHASSRRLPELEQTGLVRKGAPRTSAGRSRPEVTWWPRERQGGLFA